MSLDGLRAWIGEVERKLGVRTKVMLVLAGVAIALGGAAIYLAIDARESSVSEGDVQELQQQLEAQIGAGGGGDLTTLEAEVEALRNQVEQLRGGGAGKGGGGGTGGGNGGGGQDGASEEGGSGGGGADTGSTDGVSDGNATGGAAEGAEKLREALERARENGE